MLQTSGDQADPSLLRLRLRLQLRSKSLFGVTWPRPSTVLSFIDCAVSHGPGNGHGRLAVVR
ncbi:hypothetical protein [Streptomyces sp. NPDC058295]|uniref:hypothetical protein n=1 Tax=Streptomyces sp. NPDC058295 TaxID=3346431 RepID=UPI0036EDDD48